MTQWTTEQHNPEHLPEHPVPDDTQRLGNFDFQPQTEQPRRSGPGGGLVAGILVGALLVGGVAGVMGAAGFTVVDRLVGNGSSTSSSATSSPVVTGKAGAPAKNSVEAVARTVLPSVVKINVRNAQEQGSGSGII